jgi:hypothetical protein
MVENLLKMHQNSTLSAISRRDVMNTHWPRIVKIHAIVNPQLLFKWRTIYGGQCSCFDVTTISQLPLADDRPSVPVYVDNATVDVFNQAYIWRSKMLKSC